MISGVSPKAVNPCRPSPDWRTTPPSVRTSRARPRTQTTLEAAARQDIPDSQDLPDHQDSSTCAGERYRVDVSLPDETTILRKHAAVVVTAPMTTLMGLDDRPGTIAGAPVPADMARGIASRSIVWYCMLTDPASGRVLDATAQRYVPDRATRLAVTAKWQACTAPCCSRPARHCYLDHGVPFDHEHPDRGGRTEPANLHPQCRRHHQAKTVGRLRMRRISADEIEWIMPLGESGTLTPEEARARVWAEYPAEERQWDVHVEQVRERQHTALQDERARFQAWIYGQRAILKKEQARLALQSRHIERQRDRVTTDWRLLAVNRAALSEHMQSCGLTRPHHRPLSTDAADATTLQWKTMIVPMLVETFNEQRDRTGQVTRCAMTQHTPLVPIRVEPPAWPTVVEKGFAKEFRIGSLGDGSLAKGPAEGPNRTRRQGDDQGVPQPRSDPRDEPPPF